MRGISGVVLLLMSVCSWAGEWNFSTVSASDRANLDADKANWTFDSSNNRWKNAVPIADGPLMANGIELDFAKGLMVMAENADNIRVDSKKGSLTLNNKSARITIPGLKAGDRVTLEGCSSNSGTPRNLEAVNLSVVSGFEPSTSRTVSTGTVIADGDVVINATGGFYVYSVSSTGSSDVPEPGGTDHSAGYAPDENQMMLTLDDNTLKFYNTASVSSMDFDSSAGSVTVSPKDGGWTDTYSGNVRAINFAKTESNGGNVEIVNSGVDITDARGWFETVWLKWDILEGADSYNVYVKGGPYHDYYRIDRELVRNYGSYGRADIPGLPSGIYTVRVVPVIIGDEVASSASEARGIEVKAHDRSGFAFKDFSGVGAYADNGALKDDARVIYVTAETAKTVRLNVRQSDKDGDGTPFTGLQAILNAFQKGVEKRPLAVRILGTIRDTDMDGLLSNEGLQIKGRSGYSPVNITVEGIGEDAAIWGFGVLVRNCSSVEFRNFAIMLCMDDCLSFDTANSHCWVHNMDFFYGKTGGDADQAKGDGTVDLKGHSRYITMSYNRFWDSGKSSLCGMKSESVEDYADYHHNWFDHSDSRHPRVRTMTVHVWNNYYDGVSKYGVGATMGSNVFVEGNFYRSSKNPMLISGQGTDAKGSGTFSGENGGMIKSFDNLFAEKGTSGGYTAVTQGVSENDFDCFEAVTRDEIVPDTFRTKAGGTPYSNFDIDTSVMHSYTSVPAVKVPAMVTGYYGAGRLNHGNFLFDLGYPGSDKDYGVIPSLKAALEGYIPSSFTIF